MKEVKLKINLFFLCSYLVVVLIGSGFLPAFSRPGLLTWLFAWAVLFSYAAFYLLPAYLLSRLVVWLGWRYRERSLFRLLVGLVVVGTVSTTELFLVLDRVIFKAFGFHVNGFVLNLVATRGGISSMGYDQRALLAVIYLAVGWVAFQVGLYWGLPRMIRYCLPGRRWSKVVRLFLVFLLVCGLASEVAYGIGELRGYSSVLVAADRFPLYLPLTFKKLAKKIGFQVINRHQAMRLDSEISALRYPLQPLEIAAPSHLLNIVWLVVESWRGDAVTREVMPATWAFARQANWFTNHYSGGNGTRMGLFSMFYGLYGPYWFSFLAEQR